MSEAGHPATPLARKLGLRDGQAVAFANLPPEHADLTQAARFLSVETVDDWRLIEGDHFDYLHLFTDDPQTVREALPALRELIRSDGMIWVSWRKGTGSAGGVSEGLIRDAALADVLVDVKVCAIDDIWSGLKLVIRKEARE